VYEGGDHYIVTGLVTTLGEQRDDRPLLFHRGAYTVTERAEPTPGILDNLITWSQDDDWI
jgi:3-hydroxy-9,10-secoandrosta-1,3,5(10)-triene-9,17-dione monooxygenase reductase component